MENRGKTTQWYSYHASSGVLDQLLKFFDWTTQKSNVKESVQEDIKMIGPSVFIFLSVCLSTRPSVFTELICRNCKLVIWCVSYIYMSLAIVYFCCENTFFSTPKWAKTVPILYSLYKKQICVHSASLLRKKYASVMWSMSDTAPSSLKSV